MNIEALWEIYWDINSMEEAEEAASFFRKLDLTWLSGWNITADSIYEYSAHNWFTITRKYHNDEYVLCTVKNPTREPICWEKFKLMFDIDPEPVPLSSYIM